MRRFFFVLLALVCLSAIGCVMPGDWWRFGGLGGTYSSNTADEAKNYRR